ncbi:Prephenate dehydratase-domain-containing protein, partial [Obelidium mucronatum]
SLGQTASWCAVQLKGVERIAVPSNSAAALLASKELGAAAIAGELCADLYSLNLLERNIEDMKNNTTRFLIFGNHTGRRDEQRNKTILGLTIDNRQSGSLTAAFQALEKNGIDLIKVDSRPSKVALWNYFFFVEVVGHIEDCNVREALAELQTICQSIIVFGSFADVRQLQ